MGFSVLNELGFPSLYVKCHSYEKQETEYRLRGKERRHHGMELHTINSCKVFDQDTAKLVKNRDRCHSPEDIYLLPNKPFLRPVIYEEDYCGTEKQVKEYIEGDTIYDRVKANLSVAEYLPQIREMAANAQSSGLNIDYFPTNFVVRNGLIYYVDYECNSYMEEWNFENWGIKYWSRTPEFEDYLKKHP